MQAPILTVIPTSAPFRGSALSGLAKGQQLKGLKENVLGEDFQGNTVAAETSSPTPPSAMPQLLNEVAQNNINVTDSVTLHKAKEESRALAKHLDNYGINSRAVPFQNPALVARIIGLITNTHENQVNVKRETLKGALFGAVGGLIGWGVRTIFFEFKDNGLFAALFIAFGAMMGTAMTHRQAVKQHREKETALVQQLKQFERLS